MQPTQLSKKFWSWNVAPQILNLFNKNCRCKKKDLLWGFSQTPTHLLGKIAKCNTESQIWVQCLLTLVSCDINVFVVVDPRLWFLLISPDDWQFLVWWLGSVWLWHEMLAWVPVVLCVVTRQYMQPYSDMSVLTYCKAAKAARLVSSNCAAAQL